MATDAAQHKAFVPLTFSFTCRVEQTKLHSTILLNFPISSHRISSHVLTAAVCCCFFSPSLSVLQPMLFYFSLPQPDTSLAHICLSGVSPFFSGPPASWLQPLFRPSSFAPSACCQNSPHQSGLLAP